MAEEFCSVYFTAWTPSCMAGFFQFPKALFSVLALWTQTTWCWADSQSYAVLRRKKHDCYWLVINVTPIRYYYFWSSLCSLLTLLARWDRCVLTLHDDIVDGFDRFPSCRFVSWFGTVMTWYPWFISKEFVAALHWLVCFEFCLQAFTIVRLFGRLFGF